LRRNLGKKDQNSVNLIRFGQNQNLASPKTFDLLRQSNCHAHFIISTYDAFAE